MRVSLSWLFSPFARPAAQDSIGAKWILAAAGMSGGAASTVALRCGARRFAKFAGEGIREPRW